MFRCCRLCPDGSRNPSRAAISAPPVDKFADPSVALPELDGKTVNQLPRIFLCRLVIGTDKLNRSQHTPVFSDQARSILRHRSVPSIRWR